MATRKTRTNRNSDKSTNLATASAKELKASKAAKAAKAKEAKASKAAKAKAATAKARAKDQAAKAKAAEKRAKAKARVAAKKEAAIQKEAAKLPPLAKEINIRFEKASVASQKMIDHRLALALRLAESKAVCKQAGVTFTDWVEENINKSYGECKKLARIGESKDPVLQLEDMRAGSKERMAKKRKSERVSRDTPPAETPDVRARMALDAMKDTAQVDLMKSVAKAHGMEMVTLGDSRNGGGIDQIKAIFGELDAKQKMNIATWAANEVGLETKNPFTAEKPKKAPAAKAKISHRRAAPVPVPTRDATVDELTVIPASMRR